MIVEYQINEGEFIKLKFLLLYKRPLTIIVCTVSIILFLLDFRKYIVFNYPVETIYASLFLFISCFILIPIYSYIKFKNEYQSTKLISQKTISEIDDHKICDTTETFKTETSWENVHKVKELKNWFLFYFSSDLFGFAPKRAFSETQIIELRNLIISKNIKSDLRQD